MAMVGMLIGVAGCASAVSEAVSNAGKAALSTVGLAAKESIAGGQKVAKIQLSAGESVNSDKAGHAFAVVSRFYALKAADTFSQLPREGFESKSVVPDALKQDALAAKEQVLVPGQHYAVTLPLAADAQFLGVVMMFQSPEPARWRTILPISALKSNTPINFGVHRCSFTINDGLSDKELLKELSLVGSAACN